MSLASVDKALYNEATFSVWNKYMKTIEIDDELYQYIAGQTQKIGESASEILRRLLLGDVAAPLATAVPVPTAEPAEPAATAATAAPVVVNSNIFVVLTKTWNSLGWQG